MYPSDYARFIQTLAELMKEQGNWTPEVAFFARYFCKAADLRATLPRVEMVQVGDVLSERDIDIREKMEI